jgi:hypothetical protein
LQFFLLVVEDSPYGSKGFRGSAEIPLN